MPPKAKYCICTSKFHIIIKWYQFVEGGGGSYWCIFGSRRLSLVRIVYTLSELSVKYVLLPVNEQPGHPVNPLEKLRKICVSDFLTRVPRYYWNLNGRIVCQIRNILVYISANLLHRKMSYWVDLGDARVRGPHIDFDP